MQHRNLAVELFTEVAQERVEDAESLDIWCSHVRSLRCWIKQCGAIKIDP